jgi:hypothetical protein
VAVAGGLGKHEHARLLRVCRGQDWGEEREENEASVHENVCCAETS